VPLRMGALLGMALVAAFCTEPAGASLKRVVIVDRLDAGMPGLLDVERGNPTERKAGKNETPDSHGEPPRPDRLVQ